MVLLIVIAITVISLGFLTRCDTELACGQNMLLRTQMDQLADSALEHARGLILQPQDAGSEYWAGATGQQLVTPGSDFYDVSVARDESDPNERQNYSITCEAYRLQDAQRVGSSRLSAELRLNPAIALWMGAAGTLTSGLAVHGDVRCGGNLVNYGVIDGDVFATALTGGGSQTGQLNPQTLSLAWPSVSVSEFTSRYTTQTLTSPMSSRTCGPYDPPQIFYYSGDLCLGDNVTIDGMLLVSGSLTIHGNHVTIIGGKNLPALYVTNDLVIDEVSDVNVQGLAVVGGGIRLNAGAADVNIRGGLFLNDTFTQTIGDSTACDYAYVYGTPTWNPAGGQVNGALRFDGTDDYIEVRDESSFDISSQITIAAWIKVAAFNRSFQAILTKGDSAWRIQRYSSTNYIEFACTGLTHDHLYGSLVGSANVNDGQWRHVAGVYDGTKIYLYVDGNLDASETTSGSINTNNYRVMIGQNADRPDRLWNGWIDDVCIYNRGLSEGEVRVVKSGGSVPNLVARWRLDQRGADATVTGDPVEAAIVTWPGGVRTLWSPAAGAFYRSIHRE